MTTYFVDFLALLGHRGLSTLDRLGRGSIFFAYVLGGIPDVLRRFRLVIAQPNGMSGTAAAPTPRRTPGRS